MTGTAPPKIVAFIFARGGSKGVPRKNLREVGGRPLLARSIEVAQRVPRISRIILSTDDPEMAEAGRRFGAEVPFMRPAALASDQAREWDAWRHAVNWVREHDGPDAIDIFISLPATAPLRKPSDIERCLDAYLEPPQADMVITMTEARRNPYFNMLRPTPDGLVTLAATDSAKPFRRQDAPKVYDMACVAYVTSPEHIFRSEGVFDGRIKGLEVDGVSAIDIDTEFDLKLADMLAREGM